MEVPWRIQKTGFAKAEAATQTVGIVTAVIIKDCFQECMHNHATQLNASAWNVSPCFYRTTSSKSTSILHLSSLIFKALMHVITTWPVQDFNIQVFFLETSRVFNNYLWSHKLPTWPCSLSLSSRDHVAASISYCLMHAGFLFHTLDYQFLNIRR